MFDWISKMLELWHAEDAGGELDVGVVRDKCEEQELVNTSGYIHIVPRGHGMLITGAMKTYYVTIKQVLDNDLKTGDYVEAKTDGQDVRKITKVDHTGFDDAKAVRPHKVQKMGGVEFKLGSRVILQGVDFVDFVGKHGGQIAGAHKIALLIDQGLDCVDFLVAGGIKEVYLADVALTAKKKVLLALSTLLAAKRSSAGGEDVILFVDNLNKLFKLYNSSMFENYVEVTQLHHGCHADLKSFFMQAKQTDDKGSLTIITHLREASSELEKYALDDFFDFCSVIKI